MHTCVQTWPPSVHNVLINLRLQLAQLGSFEVLRSRWSHRGAAEVAHPLINITFATSALEQLEITTQVNMKRTLANADEEYRANPLHVHWDQQRACCTLRLYRQD
jgi:hypothetical protein